MIKKMIQNAKNFHNKHYPQFQKFAKVRSYNFSADDIKTIIDIDYINNTLIFSDGTKSKTFDCKLHIELSDKEKREIEDKKLSSYISAGLGENNY